MSLRHIYSQQEEKFIIENVKNITLKELTKIFNKKFKLKLSEEAISNKKNKLGLKSGLKGGQFSKGHIPANKGKKMSEDLYKKSYPTMFKKGNIPHNHRPIGSERIDKEGYIYIKVAEPNKWKLKHRYIYESMYGNIPTSYKLIFADGNRQNLELNNLILVSNSEELIINRNKLYKQDKDLTKTGVIIAKVIDKNNKRKKNL